MEKDKSLNNKYFYIILFLIYSFLGWIYEVCWEFKVGNGFVNRGFLHGFYLPIYGFGGLILVFSLGKLLKKKIKIWKLNITPLIIFLIILLIVSVVEFVASWGMELIFNKRWWDYSFDKWNLNGRISLRNSSLLAICGMVALYIIFPISEKLITKLNNKFQKYLALLITLTISLDFIFVIIGYIK